MPWVKLDDQFFTHPKVQRAGRDARDLYLAGLTYCARQLTDGEIPVEAMRLLAAMAEIDDWQTAARRLLEAGLWESCDGGYVVHDYLEYNPSRACVEQTRSARAEAGSRGGQASAAARAAKAKQTTKQTTKQIASGVASDDGKQTAKQTPTPSTSTSTSTSTVPSPRDSCASHAAAAAAPGEVQAQKPIPEPVRGAELRDECACEPPGGDDQGTSAPEGRARASPEGRKQTSPKQREQNAVRAALRVHFSEQTGLAPPGTRTDTQRREVARLWWRPIREIAELTAWDVNAGMALIDRTLERLQGLTITDPNSILKTARALAAQDASGTSDTSERVARAIAQMREADWRFGGHELCAEAKQARPRAP